MNLIMTLYLVSITVMLFFCDEICFHLVLWLTKKIVTYGIVSFLFFYVVTWLFFTWCCRGWSCFFALVFCVIITGCFWHGHVVKGMDWYCRYPPPLYTIYIYVELASVGNDTVKHAVHYLIELANQGALVFVGRSQLVVELLYVICVGWRTPHKGNDRITRW